MKSTDWRPTAFAETAPGVVSEEDGGANRRDQRRALFEFLRHDMTMAAGALLFTVTLIEKAFAQPVNRSAVAWAVGAFLASFAGAAFTCLKLVAHYPRVGGPRMSSYELRYYLRAAAGAAIACAAGLCALAWFFWTNWLR
ncbi:MAG: hypothetical protein ABI460_02025 [Caldimonas sp.]